MNRMNRQILEIRAGVAPHPPDGLTVIGCHRPSWKMPPGEHIVGWARGNGRHMGADPQGKPARQWLPGRGDSAKSPGASSTISVQRYPVTAPGKRCSPCAGLAVRLATKATCREFPHCQ
jgi:hypothetical protein